MKIKDFYNKHKGTIWNTLAVLLGFLVIVFVITTNLNNSVNNCNQIYVVEKTNYSIPMSEIFGVDIDLTIIDNSCRINCLAKCGQEGFDFTQKEIIEYNSFKDYQNNSCKCLCGGCK